MTDQWAGKLGFEEGNEDIYEEEGRTDREVGTARTVSRDVASSSPPPVPVPVPVPAPAKYTPLPPPPDKSKSPAEPLPLAQNEKLLQLQQNFT